MLPKHCFAVLLVLILAIIPLTSNALQTTGKQVILLDARTGTVLFEKNADERMAPSSMSKVMTIYRLFDELKGGSLSLSDNFFSHKSYLLN